MNFTCILIHIPATTKVSDNKPWEAEQGATVSFICNQALIIELHELCSPVDTYVVIVFLFFKRGATSTTPNMAFIWAESDVWVNDKCETISNSVWLSAHWQDGCDGSSNFFLTFASFFLDKGFTIQLDWRVLTKLWRTTTKFCEETQGRFSKIQVFLSLVTWLSNPKPYLDLETYIKVSCTQLSFVLYDFLHNSKAYWLISVLAL